MYTFELKCSVTFTDDCTTFNTQRMHEISAVGAAKEMKGTFGDGNRIVIHVVSYTSAIIQQNTYKISDVEQIV